MKDDLKLVLHTLNTQEMTLNECFSKPEFRKKVELYIQYHTQYNNPTINVGLAKDDNGRILTIEDARASYDSAIRDYSRVIKLFDKGLPFYSQYRL